MTSASNQVDEVLVVDRKNKSYAFFVGSEQQGNWIGYADEAEPSRIAQQHDLVLREFNHHEFN